MPEAQRRYLVRGAAFLVSGLVLYSTFSGVEIDRVLSLLDDSLWVMTLVIFPFAFINWLDALGFQRLLGTLGVSARQRDVFWAQIVGEAAILSLPLGFMVSEPLRPYLLWRRAGVPVSSGVACTAARKVFLVGTEGLSVVAAGVVGFTLLREASPVVLGTRGLEWLTWVVAVLLCGMSLGMAALLGRGRLALRAWDWVTERVPRRFRASLLRRREGFLGTDDALVRVLRRPLHQHAPVVAVYLSVWLLEALEAYVVLSVLGAHVPFAFVLSMEALLAFLRSALVILPAGLGVQDLGYVVFLRAAGVTDPLTAGAAFSLVKRSKECLWASIGYCSLSLLTRSRNSGSQPVDAVA